MTLEWQIQIIEQLIKEDPDTTIKDYLKLIDELLKIEKGNPFKKRHDAI